MKRNFSLFRSILQDAECASSALSYKDFVYPDHGEGMVVEHIELLLEAGLIEGRVSKSISGRNVSTVNRLTWKGHEAFEAMRDDVLWGEAMQTLIEPNGSVPFEILMEWLLSGLRDKAFAVRRPKPEDVRSPEAFRLKATDPLPILPEGGDGVAGAS